MLGKIAGIILIAFLIVAGYTIYQKYSPLKELSDCGKSCIDYKKIKVEQYETPVPDIRIIGADAEKLVMDIPLLIYNPSVKDTETLKLDFDVYMEGKHLTNGELPANKLQGRQNTTIWVKDVTIKSDELKQVLQAVIARDGAELLKQGKANISMTVDVVIILPIKFSAITVYTFTVPIQIETEIPVDMLKKQEEAKGQVDGAVSGILKESKERIQETLPTEVTPTPVATLRREVSIPIPTPNGALLPKII